MTEQKTVNPFPKRLKEMRLQRQLSQKQLGIAIGISPDVASARMNQYEKAVHFPKFETVQLLAKELRVPTAYFYCEEDELAEVIKMYLSNKAN